MKTIYNKIIEDSDFHGKGKNFEESYYKYIIDNNLSLKYINFFFNRVRANGTEKIDYIMPKMKSFRLSRL